MYNWYYLPHGALYCRPKCNQLQGRGKNHDGSFFNILVQQRNITCKIPLAIKNCSYFNEVMLGQCSCIHYWFQHERKHSLNIRTAVACRREAVQKENARICSKETAMKKTRMGNWSVGNGDHNHIEVFHCQNKCFSSTRTLQGWESWATLTNTEMWGVVYIAMAPGNSVRTNKLSCRAGHGQRVMGYVKEELGGSARKEIDLETATCAQILSLKPLPSTFPGSSWIYATKMADPRRPTGNWAA